MFTPSLRKVLWITLVWSLIAIAEFGHSYSFMTSMGCIMTPRHVWIMLTTSLYSGVLAGLIGGAVIVYLFNHWLRNRPYWEALLRILLAFSLVFFIISLFSGFVLYSRDLQRPLTDPLVIQESLDFFLHFNTLRVYLFWLVVVLITLITLLVDEKYGPGVFSDFLLGRYFHPRREERIFMFLDLRGSTPLAEQLGEEKFFRLIQELFRDVTPAILRHRGQIYQYVGDEIVISWTMADGLNEGHCIECFLDIQHLLHQNGPHYELHYGIRPSFKAGLHYGHVMAGEVGLVKREIAFSGDVLNTTSRIQAKCNELGVDVLLSEALVQLLPGRVRQVARALGAFPLRGKAEAVVVYTV